MTNYRFSYSTAADPNVGPIAVAEPHTHTFRETRPGNTQITVVMLDSDGNAVDTATAGTFTFQVRTDVLAQLEPLTDEAGDAVSVLAADPVSQDVSGSIHQLVITPDAVSGATHYGVVLRQGV